MRYKYVLFDLDGTLMDTIGDICDSVNAILEQFGFETISLEQCRHYVGNGSKHLIDCAVPAETDDETGAKVLEAYLPYYNSHCNIKTAPYAGIIELLNKLKEAGCIMGVVSNKPDASVKKLAEEFFKGSFEAKIGQRDDLARKPAPDTIFEAMKIMGADSENTVYIGDSEVDIKTAENAGIPCISVSYGFRTREELLNAGAAVIADNMSELEKNLLN